MSTTTSWDYTELAAAYTWRPPYSAAAMNALVAGWGTDRPHVADIGAGTGHLTVELLARGCRVEAVEPNDAMRGEGRQRLAGRPDLCWHVGTGEDTGLPGGEFDLAAFGSSFNTTRRDEALRESARLLRPGGSFACLWNHRDLTDPLQAEIEELIRARVPDYSLGSRREDQQEVIGASGLFGAAAKFEEPARYRVPVEHWLAAWQSHATLQRQAGTAFPSVVNAIEQLVRSRVADHIEVPYVTVGWIATLGSAETVT